MTSISVDYLNNIRLQQNSQDNHQNYQKTKTTTIQQRFTFLPTLSLEKQIKKFENLRRQGYWNGSLCFNNFQGTFKIEYWLLIEEQLRFCHPLKEVIFKNTQLDIIHLNILQGWLIWLQPREISIQFNHNELDDVDLYQFVQQLLDSEIPINQFIIRSNPGIFRGDLLQILKNKLKNNYHLEINDYYKSIAIINKNILIDFEKELQIIQQKLQKTQYFIFNLDGCFTEENCQGFQNLITQCYHEDNLEQLQSLNLSNSYLSNQSQLKILFESIATSKGLLSLGLAAITINLESCQALMGNRYDQLRLNELDISNCSQLDEKVIQELTQKVISRSCKKWIFDSTFIQELPVLVKAHHIAVAFENQLKELRSQNQNGKLMLEELNLKTFENYNQVALLRGVLLNIVFNELSSVKKLVLSSMDDGRCQTYINCYDICINKKIKILLEELEIADQRFLIGQPLLTELLEKLFFTKQGNLIQIKTLTIRSSAFSQLFRENAFIDYLNSIKEEYRFTLKTLHFKELSCSGELQKAILQKFLFQPQFSIEDLIYDIQYNYETQGFQELIELGDSFYNKNQFSSLKRLTINQSYIVVDVGKLIKYFIQHPQIKLEYLKLNVNFTKSDEQVIGSLESQTLKTLKIIYTDQGEVEATQYLYETILLNPYEQIISLTLNQQCKDMTQKIQLKSLQKLKFQQISSNWDYLIENFLFNSVKLKKVVFCLLTVDSNLEKAIKNQFEKRASQVTQSISILKLNGCSFETDILSYFLIDPNCKINELIIQGCYEFTVLMEKLKNSLIHNLDLISCRIAKLIIQDIYDVTQCELLWFLENIVFHKENQQLSVLSLKSNSLNDEFMIGLVKIIKNLKEYYKSKGMKEKFRLFDIDFSNNSEFTVENWGEFFESILHTVKSTNLQENEDNDNKIDVISQQLEQTVEYIINEEQELEKILNLQLNTYPSQIKKLTIQFPTQYDSQEILQNCMNKFFKQFIFFPNNQLKELTIHDSDIDLMMNASKFVSENVQQYLQLEQLKLISLKYEQPQLMDLFLNTYLQNILRLDLKFVYAAGKVLGPILELIDSGQIKQLSILKIHNLNEELTEHQSQLFTKHLIFSNKLTFKRITIKDGGILIMKHKNFIQSPEDVCQLEQFNYQSIGGISMEYFNQMLKYVLESQNLRKFSLGDGSGLEQFYNSIEMPKVTQKLEKLYITAQAIIYKELIELLIRNINTLDIVYLVSASFQDSQSLQKYLDSIDAQEFKCKLTVNPFGTENDFFFNQFLYGEKLHWNRIKYNQKEYLDYFSKDTIKLPFPYANLRQLTVDGNLEQFSNEGLSDNFFELIGLNFIFDLNSRVEEIILAQVNIQPNQCKILTQQADVFRQQIAEQNQQGKAKLSLKRFCLYYSLKILEEGFVELCKNLLFFEYISLERLEIEICNLSNSQIQHMVEDSNNWLNFQRKYKRGTKFEISHLDIGRNDLVDSVEAYEQFFRQLVFTDNMPKLKVLFVQFLSLKENQVFKIAEVAKQYLDSKPSNYISPIKEFNISHNQSLTVQAWEVIGRDLIFHQKMDLIELNVYECQFNTMEKIEAFAQTAINKAQKQNGLKLQTFICNNIILKNKLYQYLNKSKDIPKHYQDLPYTKGNNYGYGEINGKVDSYGMIQQNIAKVFYSQEVIHCIDMWEKLDTLKLSSYNLNFFENYIKVLCAQKEDISLSFSYLILDKLYDYFQYPLDGQGTPYPLYTFFTPICQSYYQQLNIKQITFINCEFINLEIPNQMQIFTIYKQILSKTNNLDKICLEYYLNDDLIELMISNGYTENDIVKLIRVIPPSKIRIENTLTLQAIKAIYSIMYDNPIFEYSLIAYDRQNFLNNGIGYSLRQVIYNIDARRKIPILIKKIFYLFFSLFVSNSEQYKFTSEIKQLSSTLLNNLLLFDLIVLSTLVYFFMCIGMPIILTNYLSEPKNNEEYLCSVGTNQIATYSYYGFAVISLLLEAMLYRKVIDQIPSHIKKIVEIKKEEQDEDLQHLQQVNQNQIKPVDEDATLKALEDLNRSAKQLMKKLTLNLDKFASSEHGKNIAFLKDLILGQLAKYDLYNDIVFIMQCYFCNETNLFIVALLVTCLNLTIYLYSYFKAIFRRLTNIKDQKKRLSTQIINDFFDLSIVGRNVALSQALDNVAPYNVSTFPNNYIMRTLLPQVAGKSINNSVKNYLLKFIIEDAPQIILQILFLISQTLKKSNALGWNIYVTIATSSFTILLSFLKFMQIRPSTISQTDFDDRQKNKGQLEQFKIAELSKEVEQIKSFISRDLGEQANISVQNKYNNLDIDSL